MLKKEGVFIPLVKYSSKVVVGSVVGDWFGVQWSVDGRFPSLHRQAVQLHCRGDAACINTHKYIHLHTCKNLFRK